MAKKKTLPRLGLPWAYRAAVVAAILAFTWALFFKSPAGPDAEAADAKINLRVRELEAELKRLKAQQSKLGLAPSASSIASGSNFSGGGKGTVREQYEALPYPPRLPDYDNQVFVYPFSFDLPGLSAKFYGGRLLEQYGPGGKTLRILVAGCGTGDMAVAIFKSLDIWKVQLPGAQLVALDLSSASLDITKSRIASLQAKGVGVLVDIRFVRGSLLETKSIGSQLGGLFDLIECAGVLHHLPDPVAGLASLASLLKRDGAMVLMVYAESGRRGIYQMQLMGNLLANAADVPLMSESSRIMVRQLLASLHIKHPVVGDFCPDESCSEQTDDHDSVLVDTFLHTQDRAYTVLQLRDDLCEPASMVVAGFVEPSVYDPAIYFSLKRPDANTSFEPQPLAGGIADAIDKMSMLEKAAVAEAMATSIRKHQFYAVHREHVLPPEVPLVDEMAVPLLRLTCAPREAAASFVATPGETNYLAFYHPVYGPLNGEYLVSPPSWILPPLTHKILKLVNGIRTTGEIINILERSSSTAVANFDDGRSRRADIKAQLVGLFHGLVQMGFLAVGYDSWPYEVQTQYLVRYPFAKPNSDVCSIGFWRLG